MKGDFVITREGPAQIMKVSTNEKYGYKKFHVRYLFQSPQTSIVDEFIPDEIQFLGAQKMIKKEVLRILKEANPNLKPSGRHVNTAIKKQIIELVKPPKGPFGISSLLTFLICTITSPQPWQKASLISIFRVSFGEEKLNKATTAQ